MRKSIKSPTFGFSKIFLPVFLVLAINIYGNAQEVKSNMQKPLDRLKAFEGYYQLREDQEVYIQIKANEKNLQLKQLWDGKEIDLDQQDSLNFFSNENSMTLSFTKNTYGNVTQVLVFDKDVWIKVKDYKPVVKKQVQLTAAQLKACEGRYTFQFEPGKDVYIQISVKENGLQLKQSWDGREIDLLAESELSFFNKVNPRFVLQFTKDANGRLTQVMVNKRDLWKRVND